MNCEENINIFRGNAIQKIFFLTVAFIIFAAPEKTLVPKWEALKNAEIW